MSLPNPDQVQTQKHARLYRQPGGPRPTNPVYFSGVDEQYLALDGLTVPIRGGIDPIRVADPRRQGAYTSVGTSESAPDFPTGTLRVLERHGSIPFTMGDLSCAFNLYRVTGRCGRLDDFVGGWDNYVEILSGIKVTENDAGTRTPAWDTDDVIDNGLSITVTGGRYAVGSMGFGESASLQLDRELLDVAYGSGISCGDCATPNDGTKILYGLARSSGAGSPGIATEVLYSLDGGGTWVDTTITGLGATTDADAIDVVGNTLVVVVNASGGYYYSPLDELGRPTTWTLVTSGFVSARAPRDLFTVGANETYFVGDGGYIYKATDITSGVTPVSAATATTQVLRRIHGTGGETLVAVGDAGAIIISRNRGATWAAATVSATADRVSAVQVLDDRRYWVGNTLGQVFYTLTGGLSWTRVTIPNATVIDDILFATQEVGYISYRNTTPVGKLYATWNGGVSWATSGPRLLNLPTYARGNRLAAPILAHATIAANSLAIAGLSASSVDGVLLLGQTSIR